MPANSRRTGFSGLPVMVAALLPLIAFAQPSEPGRFVADTAAALAAAVDAQRDALRGDAGLRAELARTVLLPRFDIETASRLILHRQWATLAPAARERFIGAFYGYLLASHGDALPDFRHNTVTLLPEQQAPFAGKARVRTDFLMKDGEHFIVDFYLRDGDAGWRIVDIIVEGVSYVRTYRSDFSAEMARNGFDGLLAWLEGVAAESG